MRYHVLGSLDRVGAQKPFHLANLITPERIFNLDAGKGWGVQGKHRQQIIYCLEGSVWVTQEGDIHDYVLDEGDAFVITLPGKVLVRAFKPARIGYAENLAAVAFRGKFSQTVFH